MRDNGDRQRRSDGWQGWALKTSIALIGGMLMIGAQFAMRQFELWQSQSRTPPYLELTGYSTAIEHVSGLVAEEKAKREAGDERVAAALADLREALRLLEQRVGTYENAVGRATSISEQARDTSIANGVKLDKIINRLAREDRP